MAFKSLRGKVVVLTGASGGIGHALAELLIEKKTKLVLASRNRKKLEELSVRLKKHGGEVVFVPTDIREKDQVQNLIEQTLQNFGTIDILVNNAGVVARGLVLETAEAEIRDVFETNFMGMVYCVNAALPTFIKKAQGQIVNMVSMSGLIGFPGQAYYCASKFAAAGYTEALRQELKNFGVGVLAVFPGVVETPMTEQTLKTAGREGSILRPVSAQDAAQKILQAVENENRECIFPFYVRLFSLAHFLFPALLGKAVSKFQKKINYKEF